MTKSQIRLHSKHLILYISILLTTGLCKAQIAYIAIPSPSQIVSGEIGMDGWAIDTSTSISSVEIIIDGINYGFAGYGGYRPDVCNAIGYYSGCPNVGWNFTFNTTVIPDGPHNVNIRVTTADYRQTYAGAQFVVDNAGAGLSFTTSYRLTNRASGLVLDMQGPTWRPGAIAQQYPSLNSANQTYRIYPSIDGFFILESLRSLKALTASYPYADGAGVQQFEFADLTEQNWQLLYRGDGYYTIINRINGQVLDLANNGSLQTGNPVVMAAPVGGPTQQWSLTPIPESAVPLVGPEEDQDIDPYDVAAPATISFAEPDQGSGVCLGTLELALNSVARINPDRNGNVRVLWAFTDASGRRPFIPGKSNLDLAWQKGFGKWNGPGLPTAKSPSSVLDSRIQI